MSMDFYIKIKAQFKTSAAIPQKNNAQPHTSFQGEGWGCAVIC